MGLVEAAEARDTDCADIRADLALSHGRGVRATGRARRHLRDCSGCREYRDRDAARGQDARFAALTLAAPLGVLVKLGLTGGGGSAAGGGAAAAGGGAAPAAASSAEAAPRLR